MAKRKKIAKKGAPEEFIQFACTYESDECLFWPYGQNTTKVIYGTAHDVRTKRNRNAHAIVCERVYGLAPIGKPEAAHKCGYGLCVNKRHLYWASYKENNNDRLQHGTVNRGSKHGMSKLTEENVKIIRKNKGKILQRELACMFGISIPQISSIQNGKDWGWLKQEK